MIFSLSSSLKQFEVTFKDNCLHFGNINIDNECFVIHVSEFSRFYQLIFSIVKTYKNSYEVKTFFFKNIFTSS